MFNTCYKRFCNLSAINSGNLVVCTVFQSACLSCRNFIGFNYQYGINYICDCTDVTSVSINLVREIRDRGHKQQLFQTVASCNRKSLTVLLEILSTRFDRGAVDTITKVILAQARPRMINHLTSIHRQGAQTAVSDCG